MPPQIAKNGFPDKVMKRMPFLVLLDAKSLRTPKVKVALALLIITLPVVKVNFSCLAESVKFVAVVASPLIKLQSNVYWFVACFQITPQRG